MLSHWCCRLPCIRKSVCQQGKKLHQLAAVPPMTRRTGKNRLRPPSSISLINNNNINWMKLKHKNEAHRRVEFAVFSFSTLRTDHSQVHYNLRTVSRNWPQFSAWFRRSEPRSPSAGSQEQPAGTSATSWGPCSPGVLPVAGDWNKFYESGMLSWPLCGFLVEAHVGPPLLLFPTDYEGKKIPSGTKKLRWRHGKDGECCICVPSDIWFQLGN